MSKGRLLITGGTGSFGNAYLQKAIEHDLFSEIVIFSRDEKKQNDQRKLLNNVHSTNIKIMYIYYVKSNESKWTNKC